MFDKVAEFCRVFCRVLASPEFLKFFGLAELLQNPSFSSLRKMMMLSEEAYEAMRSIEPSGTNSKRLFKLVKLP